MNTISVIVIVKDEANEIRDCLESVKWADEIIVLDSGSTDETVAIAQEYTSKVFITDWPGFGPQKQRALEKASCDWVLSIDADERITPKLKTEILEEVQQEALDISATKLKSHSGSLSSEVTGFYIPRQTYVCGKPIKYSGWYPDRVIRLFKREVARFSDDIVHEEVICEDGWQGILEQPMDHYSYRTIGSMVERWNKYSDMGAEKLFKKGYRKVGLGKAVGSALAAFIKLYIIKLGFLDGVLGFVIAVTSAETAFYKYIKLWQMQVAEKNSKSHS